MEKVFLSKKRNKVIIIAVMLVSSFFMMSCMTVGEGVESKSQAIRDVEQILGYEPELTNYYVEKSNYKSFKKNYYYEFEDLEGMRFTYSSVLTPDGMDGAVFYYYYNNKVNFNRRILPFYSDTIKSLCDKYGAGYEKMLGYKEDAPIDYDYFGNEIQYAGAAILIEGYDDLDMAADLITEILDNCRIHAIACDLLNTDICNTEITVKSKSENGYNNVASFKLLKRSDYADRDEIYKSLFKSYVEKAKGKRIINDLPAEVVENTVPEILHGVYKDKQYDLWTIVLDEEESDKPNYVYTLYYKEPKDREDYKYYEGYYSMDLTIQNFIAQLGGSCHFEEEVDSFGPGFRARLGDNDYIFGFYISEGAVIIKKNDDEYVFNTYVYNPANSSYKFYLTKEEMEEIFDITITYHNENSTFLV